MAMGLSHRKVLVRLYALTLVFLLMGLLVVWSRGQLVPVLLGVATLILLLCARILRFSRKWFAVGQVLGNSLGMRQQTRYALSLTHWLELEGSRHEALESLWSDFVFAARKLGFCSVKLSLMDGHRSWVKPAEPGRTRSARYEMQNGRYGILEFKVPACPRRTAGHEVSCDVNSKCELQSKGCPSDPRVFELISELLAESWTKAAAQWSRCHLAHLSFNSTNPQSGSVHKRPESEKE
jgi:hypothetical protein